MQTAATIRLTSVEIAQAALDRLPVVASLFGRAFVTEPMMAWPLGVQGDSEQPGSSRAGHARPVSR